MKYSYAVKVNGKWYPANTEIPDVEKAEVLDEEKTSEGTGEEMNGNETEVGETATLESEAEKEVSESEEEKDASKKKTGAKK